MFRWLRRKDQRSMSTAIRAKLPGKDVRTIVLLTSDAARALRPFPFSSRSRPARNHNRRNPAPWPKVPLHLRPHRLRPARHVFQHPVDDVLLEDAEVAVALQVLLHGLQFEAQFLGHVADRDHAKVGQPGLGTDRGEFRIIDDNLVAGKLVGPGFDLGKFGVETGLGVVSRVTGRLGHAGYCNGWSKTNIKSGDTVSPNGSTCI